MATLISQVTAVVLVSWLVFVSLGQEVQNSPNNKDNHNSTLAKLGPDLKNSDFKRRFDSIAGHSSFGVFGKRHRDGDPGLTANDDDAEYTKRKFDSIADNSGRFGAFGKRKKGDYGLVADKKDRHVYENIDPEEHSPLFLLETNGSRLLVLPHDIANNHELNGDAVFTGRLFNDGGNFDTDQLAAVFTPLSSANKQPLHITPSSASIENIARAGEEFQPIVPAAPFRRLRKRHFVEFDENTASHMKRKFDTISGNHRFGAFGKRFPLTENNGGYLLQDSDYNSQAGPNIVWHEYLPSYAKQNYPVVHDGFEKRRFDKISGSAFSDFGKRDQQNLNSVNDKRRFDSIAGVSSFGRFGKREDEEKRRFDSISGHTSFGSFGKRGDGEKRRFDSISGLSSFGSFGKREDGENKRSASMHDYVSSPTLDKVHANEKINSGDMPGKKTQIFDTPASTNIQNKLTRTKRVARYNNIAKQNEAENLRQDSTIVKRSAEGDNTVDTISMDKSGSRGALVKRSADSFHDIRDVNDLTKRRFDRISSVSDFGSFGKRGDEDDDDDDNIYRDVLGFPVYTKRRFDAIGSGSNFGMFGKRDLAPDLDQNNGFLTQSDLSSLADVNKRRFDRISSGINGYGSFGKRRFDRIAGASPFGGFGKRHFDRIAGTSAFGGFGKRRFDRITDSSRFHSFGRKRNSDALDHLDTIESIIGDNGFPDSAKQNGENNDIMLAFKRRFDPIGHNSDFRIFGKRNYVNDVSSVDPVAPFPLNVDDALNPSRKWTLVTAERSPELLNTNDRTSQNILADTEYRFALPFSEPLLSKRHFDSIDHGSMFRRFGRPSSDTPVFLSSRDASDESDLDNDASYNNDDNNNNDERTINTQQGGEDINLQSRPMSRELLRRIALLLRRLFGVQTDSAYYQE